PGPGEKRPRRLAVDHPHLLARARLPARLDPAAEGARRVACGGVDVLLRAPETAAAVDEARPVRELEGRPVGAEGPRELVLAAEDDRAALLVEHPPVLRERHGGERRH